MKTPEELNALRNELETLNKKLAELTEDELKLVSGGTIVHVEYVCPICGATKTEDSDTRNPHYHEYDNGEGWCDKCGVWMTRVRIWF